MKKNGVKKIYNISNMKKFVLFKGKKAKSGPVYTMDIKLSDIWRALFPSDFYEKYKYLGAVPWGENSSLFKALEPLVIFMDYKAKPWWCPRWFLRLTHLFGNDNSIVRVRNMRIHELHRQLTKGIMFVDYKTKWEWYDLRISVHGNQQINDLTDAIENYYYKQGKRSEDENK
jgi:hypothetical protein